MSHPNSLPPPQPTAAVTSALHRRRWWFVPIVFATLALSLVVLSLHIGRWPGGERFAGLDFYDYYFAAKMWRMGLNPYDTVIADRMVTEAHLPMMQGAYYLYPPWFAVAIAPFTLFAPTVAWALWSLCSMLCLQSALRLLNAKILPCITALMLMVTPTVFAFFVGQVNHEILLLLALAWSFRVKRPALAGVFLGIAGAIKLSPLLLLLAMSPQRRRVAMVSAVSTVGVLFLGGELLVPGGMLRWIGETLPHVNAMGPARAHLLNQGIPALVARTFLRNPWTTPIVELSVPTASKIATILNVLLLVGVSLRCLWLSKHRPNETWRQWAALITTSILISPLAWEGTYAIMVMAVLLVAPRVRAWVLGTVISAWISLRLLDSFPSSERVANWVRYCPPVSSVALLSAVLLLVVSLSNVGHKRRLSR